jgi:lipoprotein NlpI
MSRILSLWFVLGAVASSQAANGPEAFQAILATARTNLPAALALCDKAIAAEPGSAQPLSLRARLLDGSRRYDEAVKDLSAALKLEPKTVELWRARGEVNFKAGRFKDSVADFDRAIELSPEQAPHLWQRGISLFYARRFSDGRKQFESHRTVNPNDVENAAWHFLCAARESGVTNARALMLPVGPDARVPMKEIDLLFRGTGSEEQVLQKARTTRTRDALFYAHLYLGLYFEAVNDAARARDHIRLAANDPTSAHYMGDVARVHLRTLESK